VVPLDCVVPRLCEAPPLYVAPRLCEAPPLYVAPPLCLAALPCEAVAAASIRIV
jgi:hypothetical protein